jgi:4-amino-4-deoxy-L-arabinose transferase-like glycosyltransferase
MRHKIVKVTIKFPRVTPPTQVVILLVILAIGLRLYDLDTVPPGLYYDEIISVYHPYLYFQGEMSLPAVSVLIQLVSGKFFIYRLAGPSPFWIRFPSVLYGVFFMVVCWALAKRLYGLRVGIIASFLAAVIPWSFHFSRYGVTTSISYLFYITLAVYLLVAYLQTGNNDLKYGAFLAMAISLYTHALALIFTFLFFPVLLIVGLIFNRANLRRILIDVVLLFATLTSAASPLLITYLSPGVQLAFINYTTTEHSRSVSEFIINVIKRAYLHLSPDFLIISGGKSFASSSGGFSELVTLDSLYYYATAGKVGMLNFYGIFIYLGFLWLIYKTAKTKKVNLKTFLLIWWIVSYAITSGYAYYDNPNPARNIVGLPAFILAISLVISKIWLKLFNPYVGYITSWKFNKQFIVKFLKTLFIIVLITPSIFYLHIYFMTYRFSYNYFDYDYRLLSNYLTKNKLWSNYIVINEPRPDKWYVRIVLSFYNHSARRNIIRGDLTTVMSLLVSGKNVVIYITRETSQQDRLPLEIPSKLLDIVYFPDGEPVFAIWELRGSIGNSSP